jgi:hypothetical protein
MNKGRRLIALTLLLMISFSIPAYGWNSHGHMTVAYVAYQHLTPKTKDRVDALLRLNPEYKTWLTLIPAGTSKDDTRMMVFMIAATWPDRIKKNPQYHNDGPNNGDTPPNDPTAGQNIGYTDFARHKYWHFIDQPFSQDGTKTDGIPSPNAQTQIAIFRSTLASNKPDALKSYDLAWLLHIVGDVHQPLHCATRVGKNQPNGDNGGNLVKLCQPPCKDELHAFWDGLLGAGDSPTDAVKTGEKLTEPNAQMAANLKVADWIQESLQEAEGQVYVKPIGLGSGPFTITPKYQAAALVLAQERVALAGVRLANILNGELK